MQVVVIDETKLQEMLDRAASEAVARLRDDLERKRTPELMTRSQLAQYLTRHPSSINRYMNEGMPYEMCGDDPRFRKTDIDHWLRRRRKR